MTQLQTGTVRRFYCATLTTSHSIPSMELIRMGVVEADNLNCKGWREQNMTLSLYKCALRNYVNRSDIHESNLLV